MCALKIQYLLTNYSELHPKSTFVREFVYLNQQNFQNRSFNKPRYVLVPVYKE